MQNRLPGLFTAFLGIIVLFIVIPLQTETIDYGWLKPTTLPSVTAIIIVIASLADMLFPRGEIAFKRLSALRVLILFLAGIGGLILMRGAGFLVAATILMLVLMLGVGERRPFWLLIGVVILPATVWFCIDYLLQRPLP